MDAHMEKDSMRTKFESKRAPSTETALEALTEIASHVQAGGDSRALFRRLSETAARLVGAERAAFVRLGPDGMVTLQPDPYGFPTDSAIFQLRANLEPGSVPERVILHDDSSVDADMKAAFREAHGIEPIRNSLGVSWRSGDRVLGGLVVFDSPCGFTEQDAVILKVAARAAGIVWQYREAEAELTSTVRRLEETDAARRHLLANLSSAADEARDRLAIALHDDSLQVLTAAELHLQRLRNRASSPELDAQFGELQQMLSNVEDSVRRVLFELKPPELELPGGLEESLRDRVAMLREHLGVEVEVDIDLPDDLSPTTRTTLFRAVAEALSNIEKHARASRVSVVARQQDEGIYVEVADDGIGFVVAERMYQPGHLGLVAQRERAQMAMGWCVIESEPGNGTKLQFWFPR